jgi:lipoyl-dependent peroxiredoxin
MEVRIMATISKATATWTGDLAKGSGAVSTESGVVKDAPISWARRAEDRSAGTSPEELIAAAHASCFNMAFSARLGKNGTPPAKLSTTASITFEKGEAGFRIVSSALAVTGDVPGLDAAAFQRIAEDAKEGCPVSGALKGNVALSVTATLS